jgi:DsbC/DsbD-like thiol-disulfide interchange protein
MTRFGTRRRCGGWLAVMLAASVGSLYAQTQRPRAEVTTTSKSPTLPRGGTATISLTVKLPKNVHVQSNKPRDPLLIPTVLTIDPPAGISVEQVAYPEATELAQRGRREKLTVYGPEFEIEVHLAVAATAAAGDVVVPAQLRYQACDDAVCFPPARATTEWKLRVD